VTEIPMTFAWRGVLERDLTREELCEAILELSTEVETLRHENLRLRMESIWCPPHKRRTTTTPHQIGEAR
jgi:hypothetical protein